MPIAWEDYLGSHMTTEVVLFHCSPRALAAPSQYWISLPIWFRALEDITKQLSTSSGAPQAFTVSLTVAAVTGIGERRRSIADFSQFYTVSLLVRSAYRVRTVFIASPVISPILVL